MAAIISRSQWGARYRNGVGSRPIGSLEKYTHHTVTAHLDENASRAQEERQMRILEDIGEQRFRGGISYNYLIFPSGRIYEGASVHRIAYHSGGGRNTRGVGVAFVGNFQTNKLNTPAFRAAVWLLQHGKSSNWWGDPAFTEYHKQFRATSCPGQYVINRWADLNRAGRGGSVSAPSGVTGTADTSKRINIDTLMMTASEGVELWSHRGSNKKRTAKLGSKGWHLHVLYREGTWARVQRNGKQWVRWVDLEESDRVWPQVDVPVTDRHTTASHNAWVEMLRRIPNTDFTHRRLTVNIQNWLKWNGYYRGYKSDGKFLYWTTYELQRFLKDRGFYKGRLDGDRKRMTINAEIEYINSQREHFA